MKYFLTLVLIFCFCDVTFACSCLGKSPIDTAFVHHPVVFRGKVLNEIEEFIYMRNGEEVLAYTFEILEAMRGLYPDCSKITVYSYVRCCTCERSYEVGLEYIVFAYIDHNDLLKASICSNTNTIDKFSNVDLTKLRVVKDKYGEEYNDYYRGWVDSKAIDVQRAEESRQVAMLANSIGTEKDKVNVYRILILISSLWSIGCTGWLIYRRK